MLGNIYTDQRCPICGGKFVDMGPKYGFRCPTHKEVQPTRIRAKLGKLFKRFSGPGAYEQAQQWLGGIRAKIGDPESHGKFDDRDYDRKKPLSFSVLADLFLSKKAKNVSTAQLRNLRNYFNRAKEAWGDRNIKDIGYAEIEDFLDDLDVSSKTRSNYRSGLHSFYAWACKRYSKGATKIEMPEFPETPFTLGTRTITDKSTQLAILEQIKKDRAQEPRVWIAVLWLCVFPSLRPDDIRRIQEQDVDLNTGRVTITRPTKNRKQRTIWLCDEDLELLRGLSRGLPHMPLFRHERDARPMVKAGDVFGKDFLYQVWRHTCKKLGIEGVSLYAGTRHTTVTALQQHTGPDTIKKFTQHETNQAFDRYLYPDRSMHLSMRKMAEIDPEKNAKSTVLNFADRRKKNGP